MEYLNVRKDAALLGEMLALTDGVREVPVISKGGQVAVGWLGRT